MKFPSDSKVVPNAIVKWTSHIPVPSWQRKQDHQNCRWCSQRFGVNGRKHCRLCGSLCCRLCVGNFEVPERFWRKSAPGLRSVCFPCLESCLDKRFEALRDEEFPFRPCLQTSVVGDVRHIHPPAEWASTYAFCLLCAKAKGKFLNCKACGEQFCKSCTISFSVPVAFDKLTSLGDDEPSEKLMMETKSRICLLCRSGLLQGSSVLDIGKLQKKLPSFTGYGWHQPPPLSPKMRVLEHPTSALQQVSSDLTSAASQVEALSKELSNTYLSHEKPAETNAVDSPLKSMTLNSSASRLSDSFSPITSKDEADDDRVENISNCETGIGTTTIRVVWEGDFDNPVIIMELPSCLTLQQADDLLQSATEELANAGEYIYVRNNGEAIFPMEMSKIQLRSLSSTLVIRPPPPPIADVLEANISHRPSRAEPERPSSVYTGNVHNMVDDDDDVVYDLELTRRDLDETSTDVVLQRLSSRFPSIEIF